MIKDLIIIGGGPAGHAAALAAAAVGGKSVLLVEKDALGGTCTNRGCIPTKFLLSRTEQAGSGGRDDWAKLLAHKRGLVQGLSRSIGTACEKAGVEIVKGEGRLIGPSGVEVSKADGSTSVFEGARIILAAGSAPAQLPQFASDGKTVITSDDALDLHALPQSMAIIGSGPVGAEFAHIFTRLGVKVTLIEAFDRLFPQEDPEVHELFLKKYDQLGVEVRVGDPVVSIEVRSAKAYVALKSGTIVEADQALVGIGRRLLGRELGVESAGITLGPRGEIAVDDDMRTSVPHIFAAGDITGRMLLAHVASFQGELAARKAFGFPHPPVPYRSIPWATFTTPEIATVGTTGEAATRQGLAHETAVVPLMESVKARIDRKTDGFVKVVVDKKSGRLIGATVVGSHASDVIHILALAIHQGMTTGDLKTFCFAHPSNVEIFGDAVSRIVIV
jgi:dihydrolipoamide dehydrogenase